MALFGLYWQFTLKSRARLIYPLYCVSLRNSCAKEFSIIKSEESQSSEKIIRRLIHHLYLHVAHLRAGERHR